MIIVIRLLYGAFTEIVTEYQVDFNAFGAVVVAGLNAMVQFGNKHSIGKKSMRDVKFCHLTRKLGEGEERSVSSLDFLYLLLAKKEREATKKNSARRPIVR